MNNYDDVDDVDAFVNVLNKRATEEEPKEEKENPEAKMVTDKAVKKEDLTSDTAIFDTVNENAKAKMTDGERWSGRQSRMYVPRKKKDSESDTDDELAIIRLTNDYVSKSVKARKEEEKLTREIAFKARREAEKKRVIARDNKRRREMEKKRIRNKRIAAGIITATLLTGLVIGVTKGDEISAYVEKQSTTHTAISYLESNARLIIKNNKIGGYDTNLDRFVIFDNDIRDYQSLTSNGIEAIYTYRHVLGEEEFAKYIKTRTYTDTKGTHYYKDFEDYLKVNGFDSVESFEKAAREVIYEMYKNGEIILMTTGYNTPRRGGK